LKSTTRKSGKIFDSNCGNLTPLIFEELVGHLLVALEFDGVEVTKKSGDRGIDAPNHDRPAKK